MTKRLLSLFAAFFLLCQVVLAQDNSIEMADALRQNGKIYVVVIVLSVIFIGIVVYLVRLDRRIGRLEKEKAPTTHS